MLLGVARGGLREFLSDWIDGCRHRAVILHERTGISLLKIVLLRFRPAVLDRCAEHPVRIVRLNGNGAGPIETVARWFFEFLRWREYRRPAVHDGRRKSLLPILQAAELTAQFDPNSWPVSIFGLSEGR